jgi:hypothetical protein
VACDLPARQCLEWHVKPHLLSPKPAGDGKGYRALCPVHDDHEHSFSVSLADSPRQRLTWNCFAGCTRTRIRAVLIGKGVPDGCLPLVTKEREDLLVTLRRILGADTADHAGVRLRALAALEGYEGLPRGLELERIAGLGRVNRVTAYRARKAAPLPTDNPGSYTTPRKPVKPRRPQVPPGVA